MTKGEKGCESVGCIQLLQDSVQWQALVSTIMNYPVPLKTKNYLYRLRNSQLFQECGPRKQLKPPAQRYGKL